MKRRKEILRFLLHKWMMMSRLGAVERIYRRGIEIAKINNLDTKELEGNEVLQIMPVRQIEIIRNKIIELLPEAEFVNINYEAPSELTPDDFMELYINHQLLSIQKVKSLINNLGVP